MIILADAKFLMAFDVTNEQIVPISFDGRTRLSCTGASTANKFSSYIIKYYNLEKISEFSENVILIDCGTDSMVIDGINNLIASSAAKIKTVTQDFVAVKSFTSLKTDNNLKIMQYGMNFYGKHYFSENGKLMKKNFSLTGYCLDIEESIKFVKDEI